MTKETKGLVPSGSDFLLYSALGGPVTVRVLFKDETAWLTQKGLAELFGVKVPAVLGLSLDAQVAAHPLTRAAKDLRRELARTLKRLRRERVHSRIVSGVSLRAFSSRARVYGYGQPPRAQSIREDTEDPGITL